MTQPEARGHIDRRRFLRLTTLAGLGVAAASVQRAAGPMSPTAYLRWLARGQRQQLLSPPAVVALAHCATYGPELRDCLAGLWQQADMPKVDGLRVLIKPNLVDSLDGSPVTTNAAVVAALIDLLLENHAARVVVGDGPAFRRDAEPIVAACGLHEVLAQRGIPFVDLNYDDPQPVAGHDGWFRDEAALWLPRHVREADLIVSVPKLKTHHWAGVSASLKNLFGVIPGARYGWPKNLLHTNSITASILGVYQSIRPVVSVVDGIIGMEGDGPIFGQPVQHGLLAAGRDPFAVDATCAQAIGYSPSTVEYLRIGAWAGIGQTSKIELRGEAPAGLQRDYLRPPTL